MGETLVEETESELTEAKLRRWLELLHQPDRLADPDLIRLLRLHGRMPVDATSPRTVGRAGADLLKEKIEGLRPAAGADRMEGLPYRVLSLCFLEGAKVFQAANHLNLSERQLSRERARALTVLKAELETGHASRSYRPEPIPAIQGFLARPDQMQRVVRTLEQHCRVAITGPPGQGKSSLVAELATELGRSGPVLWYICRPGINTTLAAVLFEFGEYLASLGNDELAIYMERSLPAPDTALATRLALKGFSSGSHLIVFDDFSLADDPSISGLIDEMGRRLPRTRIVTIGRYRTTDEPSATIVELEPLTKTETRALLERLKVTCDDATLEVLYRWTEGNPYLLRLAASWWRSADREELTRLTESLPDTAEVHDFLLSTITDLLDSDDQALLEAASVFRERFSDSALAFVSERTRGQVVDASLRLVRAYVATRSRDGQSAFFHNSVRDYVYERLRPDQRRELHARAALWFSRQKNRDEADYHRRRGLEDNLS